MRDSLNNHNTERYTTPSYREEPAGGGSCAFQESCKGFKLVRKEAFCLCFL